MQQAYRMLRVVAESQTIRMVLTSTPDKLLLHELCTACSALTLENSRGIKAVLLDFQDHAGADKDKNTDHQAVSEHELHQAMHAVQALQPPVLAIVRGTLSALASQLIQTADLILVAHNAVLRLQGNTGVTTDTDKGSTKGTSQDTLTGAEALRLGLVSWSVPTGAIDAEVERVLNMLRDKSAVALRLTKASVRVGNASSSDGKATTSTRLDALKQVNDFYLAHIMQTTDATEGLRAFLEKRQPHWKNQ